MMAMNNPKTVALLFPPRVSHLERTVDGIVDYASRNGDWRLVVWPERFSVSVSSLAGWKGDGAIGFIDTADEANAASSLSIPLINLSGSMRSTGLYRVMIDNHAVGIATAEHLLERGFRRFAYYGISGLWYSQRRAEAFRQRVEDAGGEYQSFLVGGVMIQRPWHHGEGELCAWLETLKPPIALMACNDHRARMVADACREVGMDVPGDVAIVGVDNESIICELAEPTLTSVSRNNLEIGYQAATLLDKLMAGEKLPDKDILIQPDGIVQRQSTDTVCADDVHLAAAIRFIRANIGHPFDVKQLVANLSVSRRYVENGFKRLWGISPRDYIVNLRIDRAKQMLTDARRQKIESVAKACGFNSSLQLRRISRQPKEYTSDTRKRRVTATPESDSQNDRQRAVVSSSCRENVSKSNSSGGSGLTFMP